jgi:hypothetical protein
MRRHDGGAGCGTRGCGLTQAAPPGGPRSKPRRLLRAGPVRAPLNAKAGKVARRVDWRVPKSSAPARRAASPRFGDRKKRRVPPARAKPGAGTALAVRFHSNNGDRMLRGAQNYDRHPEARARSRLAACQPRRTTARISTRPGPHPSRRGREQLPAPLAPQDDGVRERTRDESARVWPRDRTERVRRSFIAAMLPSTKRGKCREGW